MQEYANENVPKSGGEGTSAPAKILKGAAYADLAVLILVGCCCSFGVLSLETMKTTAIFLSFGYFILSGASIFAAYRGGTTHK